MCRQPVTEIKGLSVSINIYEELAGPETYDLLLA
jgi:hypothetical protein